jgi:RNA polymerase sigma-70 factor (ECF subfamily)
MLSAPGRISLERVNRAPSGGDLGAEGAAVIRTERLIEDELLVLAAQDGDARALESLVRRWDGPLRRYAQRLTGRADAAQDAAQETWLAVARGIRRLDDPARFRAWAFRIAHHKCADWADGQRRDRELAAGAAEMAKSRAPDSAGGDDIAVLRREIDALPAESRAVLALFYLEGFSVGEIGEVLAVPAGTVKSRLHSARQRLRERLERAHTTGDER